MLFKLLTLLTNFHKPLLESLEAWYNLVISSSTYFDYEFFWSGLSMFSPSYSDELFEHIDFFEWYGYYANGIKNIEIDFNEGFFGDFDGDYDGDIYQHLEANANTYLDSNGYVD